MYLPRLMYLRYFCICWCLSALVLFILVAAPLSSQVAGTGRSFVLTLPFIETPSPPGTPLVRLMLTARQQAEVTITHTATGVIDGFTIPANSSIERFIDTASVLLPKAEGVFRRTIQVVSTQPVTAALVFDRGFVTEAYGAYPDSLLGFDYMAIMPDRGLESGTVIAVVGIHDKTTVTITPTRTSGSHPAGVPFSVTLNRGDVFQLLKTDDINADLSGSSIRADKPCGVLSGSPCTDLPYGALHRCNPLVEQLPSVDAWGTSTVLAPLLSQTTGVYKFLARCDNTTFTIAGSDFTLQRGGSIDLAGSSPTTMQSTQAMLVAQMVTNAPASQDSREGDPSMMIVPPEQQWSTDYDVVVPAMAPRSDVLGTLPWKHHLQVTMNAADEASVRINGVAPVWVSRNVVGTYVVGIVTVPPGRYSITSAGPISLLSYGYSATDAYGYSPVTLRFPFPLQADTLFRLPCSDEYTARIMVRNTGSVDRTVTSSVLEGELTGTIVSPSGSFTVRAHDSVQVTVRLRGLANGRNKGWLVLRGTGCSERLLAVELQAYSDHLVMIPASGSTVDFGGVPPTVPFVDTTIYLYNAGASDLEITRGGIGPGEFTLIDPDLSDFPITLRPGKSLALQVRFAPTQPGPASGRVYFFTRNCPDSQFVLLTGRQQSGAFITNTFIRSVRKLCGPKPPDTLRFRLRNLGDLPMMITSAAVIGTDAGEFSLLTPLNGITVPAEDGQDIEVEYRVGGLGARDAQLQVVSDAINRDTFLIPFPVRNDTLAIELISDPDTLGFGLLSPCDAPPVLKFMIRNSGTVPLASLFTRFNDPSRFKLTPATPGLLLIDSTQTFQLELLSSVSGIVSDTLRVQSSDCGLTLNIPVSAIIEQGAIGFAQDTLDFGTLFWCTDTLSVTGRLINRGLIPQTVQLKGVPSSAGVSSTLPVFPQTMLPGDTIPVSFQLYGAQEGKLLDSLQVIDAACGTTVTLYLQAQVDTQRPVYPEVIDFGSVLTGSSASQSTTITNHTVGRLLLKEFKFDISDPTLSVIQPASPTIVGPGESKALELSWKPLVPGIQLDDTLRVIVSEPCADTAIIIVRGESVDDNRGVTLRWAEAEGEVGSESVLRLVIEQFPQPVSAQPLTLRTSLLYDRSVLRPFEVTAMVPGTALNNVAILPGGEGRVELEIEGIFPDSGTVVELHTLVLLGERDVSPLQFDGADVSLSANSSRIRIFDTLDGVFHVTGLCRSGPTRLVRSQGMLRLAANLPNPINGRQPVLIEFEVVEDGQTELTLSNSAGHRVATLLNDNVNAAAYAIELDPAQLPSGVYWLHLQTPTQLMSRRVIVVR